jgi:DNA-binding YbaB/EbfC family protein
MARNNFRGGPPGGGMGNMQQAIRQAQKMQEDMAKVQEELEQAEYEASSGGGMVTCKARGTKEIIAISIDPEAVDPEDVEMLEDMVVAAVNAVLEKVDEETQQKMSKVTGGMKLPGLF